MKLFHETTIKFYSKKSQPKICIISDIHFSYRVKDKKLNALREKLKERNPDYIFIPGDIVDSNDMIVDKSEEKRLLNWLESLGKIATVLISEGNHDTYKKASKEHKKQTGDKWEVIKNTDFIKKVNELENVHYLDNEVYEDKNVYVLGLTLSAHYYCLFASDKKKNTSPTGENVEQFLKELDDLDQKLITNLPKNKLKFALIHSPCHLNDFRVKAELAEFDYFISGHMHNGLVPPIIDELWRSDRGLINPTKIFFTEQTRTSRKTLSEKSIIAGAITSWHESLGLAHNLNALYPSYFITLEFTNNDQYARKPYVRKKYLNY
jgi:predicted MPP superfamily phosphohydrolase